MVDNIDLIIAKQYVFRREGLEFIM